MECRKVNELRELLESIVSVLGRVSEFLELMSTHHIPDFHWADELYRDIKLISDMADKKITPENIDSGCDYLPKGECENDRLDSE